MVQPISSPLLRAVKKERALYLQTARQVFPQLSIQLIKMTTKKVNVNQKRKGSLEGLYYVRARRRGQLEDHNAAVTCE